MNISPKELGRSLLEMLAVIGIIATITFFSIIGVTALIQLYRAAEAHHQIEETIGGTIELFSAHRDFSDLTMRTLCLNKVIPKGCVNMEEADAQLHGVNPWNGAVVVAVKDDGASFQIYYDAVPRLACNLLKRKKFVYTKPELNCDSRLNDLVFEPDFNIDVSDSGTGTGTVPECSQNSDCSSGKICVSKKCVSPPPECSQDSDCSGSKICVNEKCVSPPSACPSGEFKGASGTCYACNDSISREVTDGNACTTPCPARSYDQTTKACFIPPASACPTGQFKGLDGDCHNCGALNAVVVQISTDCSCPGERTFQSDACFLTDCPEGTFRGNDKSCHDCETSDAVPASAADCNVCVGMRSHSGGNCYLCPAEGFYTTDPAECAKCANFFFYDTSCQPCPTTESWEAPDQAACNQCNGYYRSYVCFRCPSPTESFEAYSQDECTQCGANRIYVSYMNMCYSECPSAPFSADEWDCLQCEGYTYSNDFCCPSGAFSADEWECTQCAGIFSYSDWMCHSECPAEDFSSSQEACAQCGDRIFISGTCYQSCPAYPFYADTQEECTQCGAEGIFHEGICNLPCPCGTEDYCIVNSAEECMRCPDYHNNNFEGINVCCKSEFSMAEATPCKWCGHRITSQSGGSYQCEACPDGQVTNPDNWWRCMFESCPEAFYSGTKEECELCPENRIYAGGWCYAECPTGDFAADSYEECTQCGYDRIYNGFTCYPECPGAPFYSGSIDWCYQCAGYTYASYSCFPPCPTTSFLTNGLWCSQCSGHAYFFASKSCCPTTAFESTAEECGWCPGYSYYNGKCCPGTLPTDNEAECKQCGATRFYASGTCYSGPGCPAESYFPSTPAECTQCDGFFHSTSSSGRCVLCSASSIWEATQAECAKCGATRIYASGICYLGTTNYFTSTAAECAQHPGYFYSTPLVRCVRCSHGLTYQTSTSECAKCGDTRFYASGSCYPGTTISFASTAAECAQHPGFIYTSAPGRCVSCSADYTFGASQAECEQCGSQRYYGEQYGYEYCYKS